MRLFSMLPTLCRYKTGKDKLKPNTNMGQVFACALAAQPNGKKLLKIARYDLPATNKEARQIAKIKKQARDWVQAKSAKKPAARKGFYKTKTGARSSWAETRARQSNRPKARSLKGLWGPTFVISDKQREKGAARRTMLSNGYVVLTNWDNSAKTWTTGVYKSTRSEWPYRESETKSKRRARDTHEGYLRYLVGR